MKNEITGHSVTVKRNVAYTEYAQRTMLETADLSMPKRRLACGDLGTRYSPRGH